MVAVVPRSDLGFKDPFEGYFFMADDKPFLQLHFYQFFYTIFWHGSIRVNLLFDVFLKTVTEIGNAYKIDPANLNRCTARYASTGNVTTFDFLLKPDSAEEKKIAKGHKSFVRHNRRAISFARFDIVSPFPIILWANITSNTSGEIGFSSVALPPPSQILFIKDTCGFELDHTEMADMQHELNSRIEKRFVTKT